MTLAPRGEPLKLYTFPIAPNPTKVRVYLAEKGIEIEQVTVNLPKGEQRSAEHRARNPLGKLPVLELDDGSFLTESLAIIEYLEELHPEPPMLGRTPLERARARELERLADLGVLLRVARIVHATRSPLGLPPNPAVAEEERARCSRSRSPCSKPASATRPSSPASARPSPTARSSPPSASRASAAWRSTRPACGCCAGTSASGSVRARGPSSSASPSLLAAAP